MHPTPADLACLHRADPGRLLAEQIDTYRQTPLTHNDLKVLASQIQRHGSIPLDRRWAQRRVTAVLLVHGLLDIDGDRLVATDAARAHLERVTAPAGPTRARVSSYRCARVTARGFWRRAELRSDAARVIATDASVQRVDRTQGGYRFRVGLAAVAANGRWAMYGHGHAAPTRARDSVLAELRAILMGLRLHPTGPLTVITDSRRARDWIAHWQSGGAAMPDSYDPATVADVDRAHPLHLERLARAVTRRPIEVVAVRGHTGHPLNEAADSIAKWMSTSTSGTHWATGESVAQRADDLVQVMAATYAGD